MTVARPVEGEALPELAKSITQEQVVAYAEAAGDFNPIHLDPEFAAQTRFGKRIAHGMLILAFVSEMMGTAFPATWAEGGSMRVRFRAPVFPGETVTTYGKIKSMTDSPSGKVAECVVGCRKPDGTDAITGTATVPVK